MLTVEDYFGMCGSGEWIYFFISLFLNNPPRDASVSFTTIVRLIRKMHRKEMHLLLLISTTNFFNACYGFTAAHYNQDCEERKKKRKENKHPVSDLFVIFHRFSPAMNLIDLINLKCFFLKRSALALFFCSLRTYFITQWAAVYLSYLPSKCTSADPWSLGVQSLKGESP